MTDHPHSAIARRLKRANGHLETIIAMIEQGRPCAQIAQQLQVQGQEVALLVLFDSVNPGRLDGLSVMHLMFVQADELCRKICFHLLSMTRLEFGHLPAYFLERLQNVWHTLTRRAWPARVSREFLRSVLRREPPNMYAMGRRYRPKPYNGRVVLFRRSLRAISKYLDWKLGWGGVIAGELDVVEIQGGHDDMFNEPGVQRTAATLAAYLRDHPQGAHQTGLSPVVCCADIPWLRLRE